jgi:hypothetical protein
MRAEQQFPAIAPRTVVVEGGRFTVVPPSFTDWQGALDRACPGGQPDAQRLVEECLLTCVRRADNSGPVSRGALQSLTARDGDALLSAALELIDGQRQWLDLVVRAQADGVAIRGTGVQLWLTPWSFGERNDALRRALRVDAGQVVLDMGSYEQAMVRRCVAGSEPEDPSAWPVPLGEVVLRELDRLNGVEPAFTETLAACLRTGQEHPDLALLELCRAFGWTPEQAERMGARAGQRLVATLQVVQAEAGAGYATAAPAALPSEGGEGVTRILVHDD